MRKLALAAAFSTFVFGGPAHADAQLRPGIWTNVEDAYFAEEEGREPQADHAYEVAQDGRWRSIDPFGEAQTDWSETAIPGLSRRATGSGWQVGSSELRQARRFTCWVSARKFAGKADGSADWTFTRGLELHDQGGRVSVPGNGEAPDITFRLRNVTWAAGSRNRPSFVLYVHKDDPDRAESYSWASPDADLIGINLRWVQGSCSLVGESNEAKVAQLISAAEQWEALYEAGDWEAIRALYADDAVLMTHGTEKIEGADNIVTFLQRLGNMGAAVDFDISPEETTVEGDMGYLTSLYRMAITLPGGDEPTIVTGRSFLVYKWSPPEGWLLWRDMDNLAPDATPEDFE